MLSGYCAGWSLRTLLAEGFNGVPAKVESAPPKHLSSAVGQMVNFLGVLQNEWAGAQAFSQMIFFQDKRAYEEFTSGNFEFEAGVSAVAITAGVQAKAGTEGATAGASAGPATGAQAETSYYKGMVVFVQAKGGLMYEATVGGQKFSFEPKK